MLICQQHCLHVGQAILIRCLHALLGICLLGWVLRASVQSWKNAFFPEETHEFYDAVNALMEFVFSTLLDICDKLFFSEGWRQHTFKSINIIVKRASRSFLPFKRYLRKKGSSLKFFIKVLPTCKAFPSIHSALSSARHMFFHPARNLEVLLFSYEFLFAFRCHNRVRVCPSHKWACGVCTSPKPFSAPLCFSHQTLS